MNVRSEGNNGHDADMTRCLLMTHTGHFPHWWLLYLMQINVVAKAIP